MNVTTLENVQNVTRINKTLRTFYIYH